MGTLEKGELRGQTKSRLVQFLDGVGAPWQLVSALGVLAVISLSPIVLKRFKKRDTDG